MFFLDFRKIGNILRGNSNPFQLMSACLLGALLGFEAGLPAPGLIAGLVLLVIVLNANLFLFGLVTLLSKALSLLLAPLTFQAGRLLLDGPTQGFFSNMINAPVLAFFGFEYYLVTGGVLLGLIVGLVLGILVIRGLKAYWRHMAELEKDSARYQAWASKWWVRATSWIFLGPASKEGYEGTLHKRKIGNPIRVAGAVVVILVVALGGLFSSLFSEQIITNAARAGIERANGATVDLESAQFSFGEGRLTLNGLAVTDPNNLEQNLFSATSIEADLSTSDLLRKRWSVDRILVSGGRQGEVRETPGSLTAPRPEPSPEPPVSGDEATIEDYLRTAEIWKERLAQARRWLDILSGPVEQQTGADGEAIPEGETRRERLEREIRERGYDQVAARHLIEESPRFLIRELTAADVLTRHLPDDTLDISAAYLSTNPSLAENPPRLSIRSDSGNLVFDLTLAMAAQMGDENALEIVYLGLPADVIGRQLTVSDEPALSGGTIDFTIDGSVSTINSNLPLSVTLRNTNVTMPRLGSTSIQELTLPIGIRGPIDNPRISFDDQELLDALADSGRRQIEQRARDEVEGRVDEERERAEERLNEELEERGRGLLDRFRR